MRVNHNRDRRKENRAVTPDTVAIRSQYLLHQLSLPIEPTDSIKARIHRAIRNSGLSPRKAIRIWYRHACTIAAHEYLTLVSAVNRHAEVLERAAAHNHKLAEQLRGSAGDEQLALAIDQTMEQSPDGLDRQSLERR